MNRIASGAQNQAHVITPIIMTRPVHPPSEGVGLENEHLFSNQRFIL